jgi:hypothetical protein
MSALPVYSVVISPHMHCPLTILCLISAVRVVEKYEVGIVSQSIFTDLQIGSMKTPITYTCVKMTSTLTFQFPHPVFQIYPAKGSSALRRVRTSILHEGIVCHCGECRYWYLHFEESGRSLRSRA